ncbi:UNVERIFIED_CONTAM: hypothetical protein PYX00_007939 [Menopon gallinae]|uniref:DNA polymerase delta small subunit n=1 Tax=Menopon gallinae TaxID=328185 RepID=A0AAW2HMD9_9NEOP
MILEKADRNLSSLKSSPVECEAEFSATRDDYTYEDLCEKFKCRERNFNRQYAHIYAGRLNAMQDAIKKSCITKWGNEVPIRKLSELAEIKSEKCIIIGTIFKHQELKPSILKEISDEHKLVPQPKMSNYISSSDQLILEDEIQRIRLIGKIDVDKLVTGIVIAVQGIENEDGTFEVEDYTFGSLNVDVERPTNCLNDSYILFVSGMNIESSVNLLSIQLLIDWVTGELGCPADQLKQSQIIRVVIAGNSVKSSTTFSSDTEEYKESLSSVKLLDQLLHYFTLQFFFQKSVAVDIMPGEHDPSNHTLPQQPIHQCVFPQSSNYTSLKRVTNPYECILQGRRILGTSGHPINDIKSLANFEDHISILESTLHWNHIAPTAPDTIACYPYYQEDPFLITVQPDVYFAGNMPTFETKLITLNGRPVRLLCLPSFAETNTCALVNLKTLECNPLSFRL